MKLKMVLCGFCQSVIQKDVQKVNESYMDMLQIILPNINQSDYNNTSICKNCESLVNDIFKFKSNCLEIEDNIYNYKTKDSIEINLEKLIGLTDQNHKGKVCRTCFEIIEDDSCIPIKDYSLKHQDTCLAEMNFSLTKEPVICHICIEILEKYFNFLQLLQKHKNRVNRKQPTSQKNSNNNVTLNSSVKDCHYNAPICQITSIESLAQNTEISKTITSKENNSEQNSIGTEINIDSINNKAKSNADTNFSPETIESIKCEISLEEHNVESVDILSIGSNDNNSIFEEDTVEKNGESNTKDVDKENLIWDPLSSNYMDKNDNVTSILMVKTSLLSKDSPKVDNLSAISKVGVSLSNTDSSGVDNPLMSKISSSSKDMPKFDNLSSVPETEAFLPPKDMSKVNDLPLESQAKDTLSTKDLPKVDNLSSVSNNDMSKLNSPSWFSKDKVSLSNKDTGKTENIPPISNNNTDHQDKQTKTSTSLTQKMTNINFENDIEEINRSSDDELPNDSGNENVSIEEIISTDNDSTNKSNIENESENKLETGNKRKYEPSSLNKEVPENKQGKKNKSRKRRKKRRKMRLRSDKNLVSEDDNDSEFIPGGQSDKSETESESEPDEYIPKNTSKRKTTPRYFHCKFCSYKDSCRSRVDKHMYVCKTRSITVVQNSLYTEIKQLREQVNKLENMHTKTTKKSTNLRIPIITSLLADSEDTSSVDSEADTLLKSLVTSDDTFQPPTSLQKFTNIDQNALLKQIYMQPTLPKSTINVLQKLAERRKRKKVSKTKKKQPNKSSSEINKERNQTFYTNQPNTPNIRPALVNMGYHLPSNLFVLPIQTEQYSSRFPNDNCGFINIPYSSANVANIPTRSKSLVSKPLDLSKNITSTITSNVAHNNKQVAKFNNSKDATQMLQTNSLSRPYNTISTKTSNHRNSFVSKNEENPSHLRNLLGYGNLNHFNSINGNPAIWSNFRNTKILQNLLISSEKIPKKANSKSLISQESSEIIDLSSDEQSLDGSNDIVEEIIVPCNVDYTDNNLKNQPDCDPLSMEDVPVIAPSDSNISDIHMKDVTKNTRKDSLSLESEQSSPKEVSAQQRTSKINILSVSVIENTTQQINNSDKEDADSESKNQEKINQTLLFSKNNVGVKENSELIRILAEALPYSNTSKDIDIINTKDRTILENTCELEQNLTDSVKVFFEKEIDKEKITEIESDKAKMNETHNSSSNQSKDDNIVENNDISKNIQIQSSDVRSDIFNSVNSTESNDLNDNLMETNNLKLYNVNDNKNNSKADSLGSTGVSVDEASEKNKDNDAKLNASSNFKTKNVNYVNRCESNDVNSCESNDFNDNDTSHDPMETDNIELDDINDTEDKNHPKTDNLELTNVSVDDTNEKKKCDDAKLNTISDFGTKKDCVVNSKSSSESNDVNDNSSPCNPMETDNLELDNINDTENNNKLNALSNVNNTDLIGSSSKFDMLGSNTQSINVLKSGENMNSSASGLISEIKQSATPSTSKTNAQTIIVCLSDDDDDNVKDEALAADKSSCKETVKDVALSHSKNQITRKDSVTLVLNNHQLNPHELAIFKCDWCPFNTRFFQLIDMHVLTHFDLFLENEIYLCNQCPKSFKFKYLLFNHFQNEHARYCYKLCFWCVNCASSFSKKNDIRKHCKRCPRKNISVKLFKSNNVVYCMLCNYETTDLVKAKVHTKVCNTRKIKMTESEVIEIE